MLYECVWDDQIPENKAKGMWAICSRQKEKEKKKNVPVQ